MTTDAYIETLQKRLAYGLSLSVSTGDKSLDERITVALELHRLLPYCQLCSVRYVIRIIYLHLISCQPDKYKIAACTDLYARLMVAMGDHKWPAPNIPNNKHDAIRTKLQQTNALVQSAIDGEPLVGDQRSLLQLATDSDTKQRIKEAEQTAKAAKKNLSKAKEPTGLSDDAFRDLSLDIRSGSCKGVDADKVKKITNGGYKSNKTVASTCQTEHEEEVADEQMSYVTHKVRLSPNNLQKNYLQRCFGVSRFAYNWCYDRWQEARSRGERIFPGELAKQFTDIARNEYPFTYQVTHFAKQSGFDAFAAAMQSLFDGKGFPQRKRRKIGGSFSYVVDGKRKQPILSDHNPDVPGSQPSEKRQYLLIPTFGYIKMQEKLRFRGTLTSVTIKQDGSRRYYACLRVCVTPKEWQRTHRSADIYIDRPTGIDLGIHDFAVLSNGLKIDSRPKDSHLHQQKKQLQQSINQCRKAHPGHTSKRQHKMAQALAAVKGRETRQRIDFLHKVTTVLAYTYKHLAVEHLNVTDMIANGHVRSGSVIDASFFRFRTLLEQKTSIIGHAVHVADRFLPTTRTCSFCGCIGPQVPLKERTFRCPECGGTIDRDLNAAINLAKLIGMDEPESDYAANSATTALLTRSGIATHQAELAEQAGCAP